MSNLLSSLRLARGAKVLVLALGSLAACAETEDPQDETFADAGPAPVVDSSIPWTPAYDAGPYLPVDAGQSIDSSLPVDASIDSSSPAVDAGPRPDAGPGDAGGFLGGLFGSDAGWMPPPSTPDAGGGNPTSPDNPDGWKLNADSAKDCPALPPPIPIIGGLCAGVYFGCGWTNAKGAQYSCVCDWIHWLCI